MKILASPAFSSSFSSSLVHPSSSELVQLSQAHSTYPQLNRLIWAFPAYSNSSIVHPCWSGSSELVQLNQAYSAHPQFNWFILAYSAHPQFIQADPALLSLFSSISSSTVQMVHLSLFSSFIVHLSLSGSSELVQLIHSSTGSSELI